MSTTSTTPRLPRAERRAVRGQSVTSVQPRAVLSRAGRYGSFIPRIMNVLPARPVKRRRSDRALGFVPRVQSTSLDGVNSSAYPMSVSVRVKSARRFALTAAYPGPLGRRR